MPSKLIEYQVRIRNAADSADALVLTSIRNGTNPDIHEPPNGDGTTLDPYTGKITSGSMTVQVVDRVTSGTSRTFTAALEDANFRQQLGQRKTYIEFREDGGAIQPLWAGRISNYRVVSDPVWAITVSDWMRAEHEFQVFDIKPTESVADYLTRWPNRGCIVGGPILGGFREIADLGGWEFRCAVDGTSHGLAYTRFDFVRGYYPNGAPIQEIPPELLQHINSAANDLGSSRIPNVINVPTNFGLSTPIDMGFRSFPDLVVLVNRATSTPRIAVVPQTVIDPVSTGELISMGGKQSSPGSLYLNGSAASNSVTVGTTYRIDIISRKVTSASPVFWTGHPTDLLAAIWTEAAIPYVAASLTTTKNAVGAHLRFTGVFDRAWNLGALAEEAVYGPHGIAARATEDAVNAGAIEAFASRIFLNTPPVTVITDADVVQDSTEAFDLDASTAVKRVVTEHTRLASGSNTSWSTLLATQDERFERDNGDPGQIGTGVVSYRIPGQVHVLDNVDQLLQDWVNTRAHEIFDRRGRGRIRVRTTLLRTGAGASVKLGDEILVNLKQIPNKNKRIGDDPTVGARAMQVLHVTPTLIGKVVELEDSGPNAQPISDLPTHTIAASATNPRRVAMVTVTNAATLNAAGYALQGQMAVTTGGAPALTDYTDCFFSFHGLIPTVAFGLPTVTAGRTVYFRARTLKAGVRPSNWSTGVNVTLTGLTAPSAVNAVAVASNGSSLDVTWTNSAADLWTNIYVRASGAPASAAVKRVTLLEGSNRYRVDGLVANTAYTVGVQHVDPLTGDVSGTTEDTDTTTNAALTLVAPTNAAGFSSGDGGGVQRGGTFGPRRTQQTLSGRYGIAVLAREFPSEVEVEEAVETGVGAGTYGSFAIVGRVPSVSGEWTVWQGHSPNDGLRRQLRAKHVRAGYTSSGNSATVTVSPWTSVPIPALSRGMQFDDTLFAAKAEDSAGIGLASDVGVAEGGQVHKMFRHRDDVQVVGPDVDGDVAVTFAQTYQNVPMVIPRGGQYVSFSQALGTGAGARHRLRIQVLNPTATGFTSRTQIAAVGATTGQTDDFASGNNVTSAGGTAEVNLDPAGANDNTYTVNYRVSVTVDAHASNYCTATLVVAIDSNDGAGWVERATFSYAVSPLSGPPPYSASTLNFDTESKPIVVSGLGLNDDIRIRAKSFVVSNGGTGSFSLRGADAGGANPDTRNGVTYTTATDTVESAIPAAGDHYNWTVVEVV